jgi:oligoribonuclease NrnB/cAMP/cGMP phosphodiesterase (DHH superfamily)
MNLDLASEAVIDRFRGKNIKVRVTSKMSNGKVQSFLRAKADIINEDYADNKVIIDAVVGSNQMVMLKQLKPENIEILG